VANPVDPLRHEYTIETPENVTFGYDVADIGSRFIATLIDSIVLLLLLGLVDVLLVFAIVALGGEALLDNGLEADIGWGAGLAIALLVLLQFAIFWGYYMVFELVWNGQSPGKRLVGTRVVRTDGDPPGFFDVAVRNLVRIIDFLPTAYAVGLVTMFLNPQARRLGDFAAGTLVVRERAEINLASLHHARTPAKPATLSASSSAAQTAEDTLISKFPSIRRLTSSDYQLIQDALRRSDQGTFAASLTRRLVVAIAERINTPPPPNEPAANRIFLTAVAAAYRQLG
jgi:uncharacterized RDD family membrane protein YckC